MGFQLLRNMFKRSVGYFAIFAFLLIIMLVPFIDKPGKKSLRLDLERKNHEPGLVSNKDLSVLANSISINDFNELLKPILTQRVVGTPSHEKVKNYILGEFEKLKWTTETDSFYAATPNKGNLKFTNIIATYNPNAIRFLVLACHYDSKSFNFVFIGATDSAVPCAMLIYLAKSLNDILPTMKSAVSLKLIFFDGEEAFVKWTKTDSLYGSRHLASLMESRTYSVDSVSFTDLDRIDLFILLDLLGSRAPTFYSMFPDSHRWYKLLVNIETRLRTGNLLEADVGSYNVPYFLDQMLFDSSVDDDHIPFLQKNVCILHAIPIPFPRVWHTKDDDESAINFATVKNLLAIFKVFIVQYLNGQTWSA